MGYGTNHEEHRGCPRQEDEIEKYINARLGETIGCTDNHKDVAREVSDRFGVILTPEEVKDIHTSGWGKPTLG